jgi:hypothetical protein
VVGFVEAFSSGQPVGTALLAALGGALGIGLAAMGWAAALKESPLPWDGGAGGDPKSTSKLPPLEDEPPRSLNRFLVRYLLEPLRAGAFAGALTAVVLVVVVALAGCSSAALPDIKSPPSDKAARAEYFAEGVRHAVALKEQTKREALAKETAVDGLLREGCSFFSTYRAFAPDLQAFADVDALCKGYMSTPAPAALEPPAPETKPEPSETNPTEPETPAPPAETPDASVPATG